VNWAFITDRGGIGDVLATAIVLRQFRGRGIGIAYCTRLWDTGAIWSCLRPGWDHLCSANREDGTPSDPVGARIAAAASVRVSLTPFRPEGRGGFYEARRKILSQALGIEPVDDGESPFNDVEFPAEIPRRPYVVLHTTAAWEAKSLGYEEAMAARDAIEQAGFEPVLVPRSGESLECLVTLLRHAAGAVCVDSCVSHLAYWLLPAGRLLVIYRDTDPGFLLASMPRPPAHRIGFDRTSVNTFASKLKDQPCP